MPKKAACIALTMRAQLSPAQTPNNASGGRGWYFGVVTADTKDVDTLYVANTSVYKSTDGGKNFTAFKGAPGGDDYHSNLDRARRQPADGHLQRPGHHCHAQRRQDLEFMAQPATGQMYHVVTDIRTPYWVYGAQQDSGAIAVPSRSPFGSISMRDWRPIPVGGESGSIATDPLNGNIVYGGTVTRLIGTPGKRRTSLPRSDAPDTSAPSGLCLLSSRKRTRTRCTSATRCSSAL